ncbi:unnamed protein product [Sphagnum troendelagicum]|uniref:Pentatricopeptide repeat-containing protein n=1 Tax=Sphagnum troendelagicum TaxID=128251 RepID=A0ABP0U4C8_9BRYO
MPKLIELGLPSLTPGVNSILASQGTTAGTTIKPTIAMVKMMVHGAEGVETRTSNVNLGDAYQDKGLLFKNCEGQLGEMNVRKRREWHSNTGRKLLTKKHGERISLMLEALEQNSNIDEALLWHGKLKVKEQSILLNAQQRWDRALVLYSWLKAQDYYKPNVYHYNILFRIFGRAGKWDLVQDLWAEMKTEKISATNVTFSTLIDGYAKSWRKEDAIVCFESMKQSGLQPDEVTINTLINAYKRFGDLESGTSTSMISLERGFYPKNVETYNTMMDLYCCTGQFTEASRLLGDMMKVGVAPSIVTFNIMIKVCGRDGRLEEAKAIYRKMKEKNCVPDIVTYNTLIALYLKAGKKQAALTYYRKMKEEGLCPDAVTFETLLRDDAILEADITAHGDLSKNIATLMEDLASGVGEVMHRSEITLTIMLNLYKRAGMTKDATSVARRMWKGGLLSNLVSFNSVLEMSRSVAEATEIFDFMKKKGITPDISTYNSLAAILKKAGLVEEGLQHIKMADSVGLALSLHILTTAVSLYSHAGMHDEALEACQALRKGGFRLDTVAYTAMIFAFGNAGHLDEALRISMEMQAKGLKPDVVTYTTVISVYAKMGLLEGVARVFKRMKRAGCEPDDITYNAIIKSYRDAGREDLAAMVFQEQQFSHYVLEQSKRNLTASNDEPDI